MDFADRIEEMARLDSLLESGEGGLIVLWGRRRIGKTRLLLEWVKKYNGIYYTADESTSSVQRKYFALSLDSIIPGFSSVEYPDWWSLLSRLGKEAKYLNWRGPLIIDELPYIINASPEFPSLFQKFVDRDAKEAKLTIALCGSSQRMMQGAVLEPSAPLYGRATELFKLQPIPIGYVGEALRIENPREILEHYAIWGGIPRYWELLKKELTLVDNIDRLVLAPMGTLNDEPNRLLLDEIPTAISLRPILDTIGLGANRLSEIAARVGVPATSLSRPIQRLMELDLVEREIPFGSDELNSKRALYKIKDPFVRFWFEAVAQRRSYFAQAKAASRKQWLKKNLSPFFAKAWEEICRQAVPLLSQNWGDSPFAPAGRYWQGQQSEWDIVSKSLDNRQLLVGEAKWTEKTPALSWINQTLDHLKSKGFPPIPRLPNASLMHLLFIREKPKGLILPENVKVIDANEVISVLK